MALKKYTVRQGFVVIQDLVQEDGTKYQRTYRGGEQVTLEDDQASDHIHKLEFAEKKDRDAALAAEKAADIAQKSVQSPIELINSLVAALSQAQAAAGVAAAPAPTEDTSKAPA